MVIGTFGASTAWVGRTVTYDGRRFEVEGVGPTTPEAVLAYDRDGHLTWASDDTRRLTMTLVDAQHPVRAAAAVQTVAGPARQDSRKRGFPVWAIALVVAAIVLCALVAGAVLLKSSRDTQARNATVVEGIRSIQVGLDAFAVETGGHYPLPWNLGPDVFTGPDGTPFVAVWPTNPYNHQPMAGYNEAGDCQYHTNDDLTGYTLVGLGGDGNPVVKVSGPSK